ncbi:MAG: S24 family peptidase [Deltaproteobacteria bacterium]|nr:MAG: S24 family peptidase [Deltaproteobacteria bacterium]
MARSEAVSVGACSAPAREARGGLTVTAPEARTIWAGRSVFAVCVRGASMDEDGLRDGDRLIVEPRTPADGQTALVEVDGRVGVKRLVRGSDGTMRLLPASPALLPLVVAARKVRLLGVVVGVVRRHGFRATARRPEPHRRSPADAREPNPPLLGPHLRAAGERTVARRATARPSLVDDLARSLRALRDCYRDTANPRLRRALLREARELVRRLCRFGVELQ